jgi:Tol biopolymer transport system component/DNA-binding winged helix-turn-helix (wHTH) protein
MMMASKSFVFRFADVEVREREFTIVKAGEALSVEPKAFRVLLILLRNPGKLIPKEELLNAVWGDAAVTENSLTRSIALLRTLLGDEARDPRYIETVATVGYRWVCKVEVSEDDSGILEGAGESAANGIPADAEAPPSPETQEGISDKPKTGGLIGRRRSRFPKLLLSGAAVIAVFVAILIWFLHRPLPPSRIAGFTQITHDGREKQLVGTDGSRLYFTQMQPKALAVVGVSGGEVAQIPAKVPGIFYLLDVAPDGSNLLVQALEEGGNLGKSLFDVGALGGTVRRLGYAEGAAFSPDGNSIAYITEEGELWLVRSDGTGAHKLASVGNDAVNPHWSPDGGVIGFDRNGEQHEGFVAAPNGSLWEISSDGSNLHKMLPGWPSGRGACCGRWTPDGRFYLFLSPASVFSGGDQIWVLDERRGPFRHPPAEPVQLTSGPISWSQPIPGKDGKTIFSEGRTHRGELCRFDSTNKQLLPYLGGISAQDVSFSKNGQFVAYVSYPNGMLWKANRDGSNPVQLSRPPIYAMNPRWSPDSTQILFTDTQAPDALKIYLVSSEGGSLQRLLPDDTELEEDPNWSADGRKVVFDAAREGPPAKDELHILDLSSHEITVLPGSAGLWSPRWSPNGRYIAAMSNDFPGLKILDTATQHWSSLPVNGRMDYPAWSSDSQSIYFLRLIDGDRGVYRVRVTGGKTERVADLKDWHITGYYSFWMALDPTDAPLLLRDIGSDDIYALALEEK